MAQLKRFDVAENSGVKMVVIESELLPPDPAIVVIPLLRGYPAIPYLNPEIKVSDEHYTLATRLIASVRRSELQHAGSVASQRNEIIRAIDVLLAGV